jgi:HlyD family secretion protein
VLSRIEVKSPEADIVTDLKFHTPGGVQPGDRLTYLVPREDRLIIAMQVRPEGISAVRPGLSASVRLMPYKQRRTPPIDGTVTYVSADKLIDKKTNQPYYAARFRLDAEMLAQMPEVELAPCMPADAMIKTGERTERA